MGFLGLRASTGEDVARIFDEESLGIAQCGRESRSVFRGGDDVGFAEDEKSGVKDRGEGRVRESR